MVTPVSACLQVHLLYELSWLPFESLLAGHAAKMIGFAIVGDFELGCLFVKNHAANRISRHYLSLNLMYECTLGLLCLVVKRQGLGNEVGDVSL